VWAIGLMSGTSLDGMDAALLRTDGNKVEEYGASLTLSYPLDFQNRLREAIRSAVEGQPLYPFALEQELTRRHAEAVEQLLQKAGMRPKEVEVIGFHGQTLYHAPKQQICWQMGDGNLLAELTGINVVADFRRRDIAAGGQGAPLVPLYHQALALELEKPLAVVNIGGIGNVTYLSSRSEEPPLAFDTGPGNVLLNEWMYHHAGMPVDTNGQTAARGKVYENLLEVMLEHPYFAARPPKSLDRHSFSLEAMQNLTAEDGAATLTAFTAQTIAQSAQWFPEPPKRWIICGGGRRNPVLMAELVKRLPQAIPCEAVGWEGDILEAQAFAFLAVRSLRGLPLSLPTTTGVNRAVTGGAFYRA
jgi:anhydro-N-acetylmuramic acid kinase